MSASASPGGVIIRRAEPVMGTVVSFDVRPGGLPRAVSRRAVQAACAVLHRADETFSLYRFDTPLNRMRRGELAVDEVPADIDVVIDHCARVRELSGGWFDPWALPGGFDPTGLVKGWAAEQALARLQDAGVAAAMVGAAGDIALFGTPAADRRWRVGVRSPWSSDELCCVVTPDAAIATSGHYERGPHVINPRTGKPADAALSATVCGPRLTVADGLATGLLAAGRRGLPAVVSAGYEALLVEPDGDLSHTSGFPVAS